MPVNYLNENLEAGNLGYLFVVLSFGAAILGLIAYFLFMRKPQEKSWRNLGRYAFFVHGLSVIGIFCTLFYLIYNHQYQYHYVWEHSSRDLPVKYIISSFWAGQEGSFLLWTLWHFLLGSILIFTAKTWEGPVLFVICMAQVTLASMLLGIKEVHIFGALVHMPMNIGSNPFILLRQVFPDIPFFTGSNAANYMQKVLDGSLDGRGLNPLLQNYWMTIHPPVLFLGFASTIVPFAFAMGGLWQKRYGDWIKPALPWAIFGGMILGTGVLMGGAWAYEALSFGGFWAWDPVENASLVPWLVFIGGMHTMVIYRSRKTSLHIAYILIILTFLLILYSTFLTRSGILGDTSVHAFTDLGLSGQLLIFMGVFVLVSVWSLATNWKKFSVKQEEDDRLDSREFWMFIGALLLLLSAIHITAITSLPVFSAIFKWIDDLFNTKLLPINLKRPDDAIATYHLLQIPFAIVVSLLTGFGQFLKYRKTDMKIFWRKVIYSATAAAVFGTLMLLITKLNDPRYVILLYTSMFAICGNAEIIISFIRAHSSKSLGAPIAHVGFGFILLGALIANAKKETISLNTERFSIADKANSKEQMENKVLFKDFPVAMHDYMVTFKGDSQGGNNIFFKVNYKRIDSASKKVIEDFNLYPKVIYNKEKDAIEAPSPDTRHYWTRDIFTHITSASDKNMPAYQVKYDTAYTRQIKKGQTIILDSLSVTLDSVKSIKMDPYQIAVQLSIKVTDGFFTYYSHPVFAVTKDGSVDHLPSEIREMGVNFYFMKVPPQGSDELEIYIMKGKRPDPQFITLKAIIFPFINFLWMGALIMIIGFLLSIWRHIKQNIVSIKKS